jgi:hypothetical protein
MAYGTALVLIMLISNLWRMHFVSIMEKSKNELMPLTTQSGAVINGNEWDSITLE